MSGALDPIQENLPFELPVTPARPVSGVPSHPPSDALQELPPSIYEQAWSRLSALPWRRWGSHARPAVESGVQQLGTVAQLAVTRGTPYTLKLARATASMTLVRAFPLLLARTIHIFGFPAVVLRTAIQCTVAHRMGLLIDEVTYFRVDDPAGFTVYEAPARLSSAIAIAYLPTLVLMTLSLICLAPALTPRAVLHLPTTWLTWVQLWLGLAFASHALPAYEEAGPVAEQARVGVAQADPVAVFWVIPAQAVALITRFGGIAPAIGGSLAMWWLATVLFR